MTTTAPTPRQRALLDYYIADPKRNATEAARRAGYKNPRQDGSRIVRQFRHLIDSKLDEATTAAGMKAETVLSEIASIAVDPTHKDRLRALELLAKMHGLMSDKVPVDKKSLQQQLEDMLKGARPVQADSKPKTATKLVLVRTA